MRLATAQWFCQSFSCCLAAASARQFHRKLGLESVSAPWPQPAQVMANRAQGSLLVLAAHLDMQMIDIENLHGACKGDTPQGSGVELMCSGHVSRQATFMHGAWERPGTDPGGGGTHLLLVVT